MGSPAVLALQPALGSEETVSSMRHFSVTSSSLPYVDKDSGQSFLELNTSSISPLIIPISAFKLITVHASALANHSDMTQRVLSCKCKKNQACSLLSLSQERVSYRQELA